MTSSIPFGAWVPEFCTDPYCGEAHSKGRAHSNTLYCRAIEHLGGDTLSIEARLIVSRQTSNEFLRVTFNTRDPGIVNAYQYGDRIYFVEAVGKELMKLHPFGLNYIPFLNKQERREPLCMRKRQVFSFGS